MANIFEFSSDLKLKCSQAIDDLIEAAGKSCKLVYPPIKWKDCPDCSSNLDPIGRKRSNRYIGGQLVPININDCKTCGGKGKIPVENSETIKMLCDWNPRNWVDRNILVRTPETILQTKGYMKDIIKVKRALHMIVQVDMKSLLNSILVLSSPPIDDNNLIQGNYFVCFWKMGG